MLGPGSGSGSGVGVLTTTDGGGVGTMVSCDSPSSWTEASGVDILTGGDCTAGGVGTGVVTGVLISEIYDLKGKLINLHSTSVWLKNTNSNHLNELTCSLDCSFFSISSLIDSTSFSSSALSDGIGSSLVTEGVGERSGVTTTADSCTLSSDSGGVYSGVGAGVGNGVPLGEGVRDGWPSSAIGC